MNGAAAPLVELDGLDVILGGRRVLHGIDLAIAPGEIVTIVGPNGSGKSTLLRAIIGAVRPAAGEVRRRPGLRLGYVPQRLHIDATLPLTVRRFLSLPAHVPDAAAITALAEAGAGDLAARQMAGLSGGQLQRVLLARALLGEPHLLILDEPTQGLAEGEIAGFKLLLREVATEATVLLIEHNMNVVMETADRVSVLDFGRLLAEGTPREIHENAAVQAAYLGTG